MALFSAVCVDLSAGVLIVCHSFEEADLWSKVSTNVLHLSRLRLFFDWLISSLICDRAGEVGSRDLTSSRALTMSTMSAGRASVWSSLCLPEGMCCDAAVKMAARSIFSTCWQSVGSGSVLSVSSMSLLYLSQFASSPFFT